MNKEKYVAFIISQLIKFDEECSLDEIWGFCVNNEEDFLDSNFDTCDFSLYECVEDYCKEQYNYNVTIGDMCAYYRNKNSQ